MKNAERQALNARWREIAKRISGSRPMRPPELCKKCVWSAGMGEPRLCPFPVCVVRVKGWPLKP